ncbi:MAG TPA: hypothetical protein VLS45_08725 [Methylomicrobium sp.]|nr:hypothetical protein [Methylomicrobium sp.]
MRHVVDAAQRGVIIVQPLGIIDAARRVIDAAWTSCGELLHSVTRR